MTLTPERWQRARDVLHEAMEMDAAHRSAFLDSQCDSDPSLRVEFERTARRRRRDRPQFS